MDLFGVAKQAQYIYMTNGVFGGKKSLVHDWRLYVGSFGGERAVKGRGEGWCSIRYGTEFGLLFG